MLYNVHFLNNDVHATGCLCPATMKDRITIEQLENYRNLSEVLNKIGLDTIQEFLLFQFAYYEQLIICNLDHSCYIPDITVGGLRGWSFSSKIVLVKKFLVP